MIYDNVKMPKMLQEQQQHWRKVGELRRIRRVIRKRNKIFAVWFFISVKGGGFPDWEFSSPDDKRGLQGGGPGVVVGVLGVGCGGHRRVTMTSSKLSRETDGYINRQRKTERKRARVNDLCIWVKVIVFVKKSCSLTHWKGSLFFVSTHGYACISYMLLVYIIVTRIFKIKNPNHCFPCWKRYYYYYF